MDSVSKKTKLAIVFGTLPNPSEVDQFKVLGEQFDLTVISTDSICGYLNETSRFNNLRCLALPDHDENPTYMPGLEQVLKGYDIVIVKERLGLYAFQAVKSKFKNRFRLGVWIDNLATMPAEDVGQMRTIRHEVSNAADVFIVQSQAARVTLEAEGIEKERIAYLTPWVEATVERTKKAKAAALQKLGLAEGNIVLAHFGQIEWEESLIELGTAVKLAIKKSDFLSRQLRLVFCGIGSFSSQYRQILVNLGIDDRVIFIAPGRQALQALLTAADAVFLAGYPARDRIEGEPFRYLAAMSNGIPLLSSRTALVDELCGKHRIDFCATSPESISEAFIRLSEIDAIKNDISKKNLATVKQRFSEEKARKNALELFTRLASTAPSVDPSSVEHQVAEAESLVTSRQYLKAIDMIESIFKVENIADYHQANLYRLIGDCFTKLGDNEGGKNSYIKSIELDGYSSKAYVGLGTIGLIKQSPDIAVIHFQKAVSLSPSDEMANLGLGLAFHSLDEASEASKWVTKSLEINPENTAAIFTLVKIAYERQVFGEARLCLERYLSLHPHDHNMLFTLCGILFKMGEFSDVLERTQALISADPMDTKAHDLQKQAKKALEQGLGAKVGN